jgi:flagellar biogenesis protein FliO
LRVALLSTWIVGAAATAHADGPVVVPDDRVVNFTVDAAAEQVSAEVAPLVHESLPLGESADVPEAPQLGPVSTDEGAAFGNTRGELLRVGGPLLGVVTLMIVLGAALRRFGGPLARGGRPSGVLEVLGRYPIARGQQLVLLRMVSRIVLLHQGRNGLTTLSEVVDPDEVATLLARVESASRSSQPGRFRGLLAGAAAQQDGLGREMATEGKVVVDLTRRPGQRALRSAEA